AEVRRHVPARDQQSRRAPGAPAATDGADAVIAAEPQPRGARRAASDDGRAPAGRLASPRALASVRLHAGDDAAVRAVRALPVLRRGPAEHGRGDAAHGAAATDGSARVAAREGELSAGRCRPLPRAGVAWTRCATGARPAAP